ncbi:MAG TPA: hypothetical protein DDZ76_08565 [Xanthomonadales bacterium]|nr:hypothetical protein [Xanthomonadales bacterium]
MNTPLCQQLTRGLCAVAFVALFAAVQWAIPDAVRMAVRTVPVEQQAAACTEQAIERSADALREAVVGLRL